MKKISISQSSTPPNFHLDKFQSAQILISKDVHPTNSNVTIFSHPNYPPFKNISAQKLTTKCCAPIQLEEIDFSHCKLGDKGAHAVGEFLSMHKALKILHLTNNDIGPDGVAGVIYGLLKREHSTLKHLNLRLNPLLDAGAAHVCAYLVRTDSLEVLNLSGCGIRSEGGAALVEVLNSGCVEFETLILDVSNNDFGEAVGVAFEAAVKSAPFIVDFDARMCNFSGQSEGSIYESRLRNKERRKKEVTGRMLDRMYSVQQLVAIS